MRMAFARMITIVWACAWLLLAHSTSLACELEYEVRSKGDSSALCVTVAENEDGTTYRSAYRDVKQQLHYDGDHRLIRWEYADKDTRLGVRWFPLDSGRNR